MRPSALRLRSWRRRRLPAKAESLQAPDLDAGLGQFPADALAGGFRIVHRHVQAAAEHRRRPPRRQTFRARAWFRAAASCRDAAGCARSRGASTRPACPARSPCRDTSAPAVAVFGFVHVVGADEDGVAGADRPRIRSQNTPRDGVDARGRLVQKQDRRIVQDGAAQRQPLLPAARERAVSAERRSVRRAISST
jgi:hypothetical protein